jgi:hypothetical protein
MKFQRVDRKLFKQALPSKSSPTTKRMAMKRRVMGVTETQQNIDILVCAQAWTRVSQRLSTALLIATGSLPFLIFEPGIGAKVVGAIYLWTIGWAMLEYRHFRKLRRGINHGRTRMRTPVRGSGLDEFPPPPVY